MAAPFVAEKADPEISRQAGVPYPETVVETVDDLHLIMAACPSPGAGDYVQCFDGGIAPGWTLTGLWHPSTCKSDSPSHSLAYNKAGCPTNYDTGVANSGTADTPSVSVPAGATNVVLRFTGRLTTECGGSPCGYDLAKVELSVNGGGYAPLGQVADTASFTQITFDITSKAPPGSVVNVRFAFDTVDDVYNNHEGWYIDNVHIDVTAPAGGCPTPGFKDYVQCFDSGSAPGWSLDGLWHPSNCRKDGGSYSLGYQKAGTCPQTFNTGASTTGHAITPDLPLPSGTNKVVVKFASWSQTENAPGQYDRRTVHISVNGAAFQQVFEESQENGFHARAIDITSKVAPGTLLKVRFTFDSVDSVANDYEGWYIDSVFVDVDAMGPFPACSDGVDNDGDGKIDWPADPGCSTANDNDEVDSTPACGSPVAVMNAKPVWGFAPLSVILEPEAKAGTGCSLTSWTLDLKDGTPVKTGGGDPSSLVFTANYGAPGNYEPLLKVTQSGGATFQVAVKVTAFAAPAPVKLVLGRDVNLYNEPFFSFADSGVNPDGILCTPDDQICVDWFFEVGGGLATAYASADIANGIAKIYAADTHVTVGGPWKMLKQLGTDTALNIIKNAAFGLGGAWSRVGHKLDVVKGCAEQEPASVKGDVKAGLKVNGHAEANAFGGASSLAAFEARFMPFAIGTPEGKQYGVEGTEAWATIFFVGGLTDTPDKAGQNLVATVPSVSFNTGAGYVWVGVTGMAAVNAVLFGSGGAMVDVGLGPGTNYELKLSHFAYDFHDTSAPSPIAPILTGPGDGKGWFKGDVTVGLRGFDSESCIKEVKWRKGPADPWKAVPINPATYMADIIVSGEGVHTIEYKVVNWQGLESSGVALAQVKIDTTAPQASLTRPTAGNCYVQDVAVPVVVATCASGTVLTLTADAFDAFSGTQMVKWTMDGSVVATDTTYPYSAPMSLGGVVGNKVVKVCARDLAGNEACSSGLNVVFLA